MLRNWLVAYRDEGAQGVILNLLPDLASANPTAAADVIGEIFKLGDSQLSDRLLDRLTTPSVELSRSTRDGNIDLLYAFSITPIAGVDKSQVFAVMRKLIAEESETGALILERMLADLEVERTTAFEVFRQVILPATPSSTVQVNWTCLETMAVCAIELGQERAIVWCVMCAYAAISRETAEEMLFSLASAPDSRIRMLALGTARKLMTEAPELGDEILGMLGKSPTLRLDEVHEALGEEMVKLFYTLRPSRSGGSGIPGQPLDLEEHGAQGDVITITPDDLQVDGITIFAADQEEAWDG